VSREITVVVSDLVYSRLARRARDIGRGTKPENVAEEWIEIQARTTEELNGKFLAAARIVDRRLQAEAGDG